MLMNGRVYQAEESIASFLNQNWQGDSELIIINCQLKHQLVYDHPRVRIANAKEFLLPMVARNQAVNASKYDNIVLWDELGFYLPNFLTSVAKELADRPWCYFEKEYFHDGNRFHVDRGSEFSFAFTKKAWLMAGKFQPGVNGFSERNLVGAITKLFPMERTAVTNSSINLVRMGTAEQRSRAVATAKTGKIELQPSVRTDYGMQLSMMLSGTREHEVCVVELGRAGDIINILPYLQMIHERYKTPHVMVSKEFESVLDGISYVKPFVTHLKNEELGQAVDIARRHFSIVICAQVWGKGWTQRVETKSYNIESWRNCGILEHFYDQSILPIFDRRDVTRESQLVASTFKTDKRKILVNSAKGVSSPCAHCTPLYDDILQTWGNDYEVINLSEVRGDRIYDLLALFEASACLVTIDTSFLHLAPATGIPIINLFNPKPWAGTVVRGNNEVARISYDDLKAGFGKVHEAIAAALERPNITPRHQISVHRAERRIFHAVERHEETDQKTLERKMICWRSWDSLYETGELIPCHYWNYERTADKVLGDRRALPFLKDALAFAMKNAEDDDIIAFTNDDDALHPDFCEYLKFHVSVYGPCTSFRSEHRSLPSFDLRPHQFDQGAIHHMGRDLLAATKRWFVDNWDNIPDFVLGASDWDLMIAALIRQHYGIDTTRKNITELIFPAEIMRGYVSHIEHRNNWSKPDNVDTAPSQIHNRRLWREWAAKNLPDLQFNANNTI